MADGAGYERDALAWWSGRQPSIQVLERNVRYKSGELDAVAWDSRAKNLVFVEVRYRSASGWVPALESVSVPKRWRIERAAAQYLATRVLPRDARGVRFDLLVWENGQWIWIPDAWSGSRSG